MNIFHGQTFFRTISSALQNVLTLPVPLSVWMVLIAEPAIRLIFQQGRFDASDIANTARLLQVMLICVSCGIPAGADPRLLRQARYLDPGRARDLRNDTHDSGPLPANGAHRRPGSACASTASLLFHSAAMTTWWKARSGGAVFSGLPSGTGKVLILSLISVLPASAAGKANPFDPRISPYLAAFCEIILSRTGLRDCIRTPFRLLHAGSGKAFSRSPWPRWKAASQV